MSHTASTANTHVREDAHVADRTGGEIVVTEDGRVLNDPTHAETPGHGNTPGAWLMAGLVVLGFLVGAIALFMDAWLFVWIGVALVAVGAVIGLASARMDRGRSSVRTH